MNHDEFLNESLATFNRMNRHGAVGITESGDQAVPPPTAMEELVRQKVSRLEHVLEHFRAGETAEALALIEGDSADAVQIASMAGLTENPNIGLWMGNDDDDDDDDDADPGPPPDPVARAEDLDEAIDFVEAKISLTNRMLAEGADLPALLGRLERHGYEGYFSIELFNEELWAMPVAEAAKLMYDSLLWLCET